MTYNSTSIGGIAGIVAAVASVVVTVVEVVKRIVNSVKERKATNNPQLPCNGHVVDMVYNDNAGSWHYQLPVTNMNPMNIGNINNGGNRIMSGYDYDVFRGSELYDTPTTCMFNRNLPYGFGYNPNKQDYIWQDRTLGQVPSTTEYVPFEARTGFDPVPWLKASNSYVATMDPYYPYRNTNQFIKFDDINPPKDDSYLKDPNAGILYKDLKNHFNRRVYNPYEPSRPFATYAPGSIRADDPAANPYNMTQEQIDGIINRTNYYKDLILNIRNGLGSAPNDVDNPYNLLGGPSYVGPDGNLYIRQVPEQPEYHARREFLNAGRTKPYPTIGGEAFGRSMYHGFDFQTLNQPNTGYNNISLGGANMNNMYDTQNFGVDQKAPPLLSIPYIQSYIQRQQAEQQRQKMIDPNSIYQDTFASPRQNNPQLLNPNVFANPYSMQVQNQIDRSQLMIDPKCGMDFNNGDPNDRLAMLLQIQPPGEVRTPQQEIRNQMIMNQMMNGNANPMSGITSVLGPNTNAGMLRQNMNINPNMFNLNQAAPGRYIPNADAYGMVQQAQMMRQSMNGGSVFVNEYNTGYCGGGLQHANANYGMPQPQMNQMNPMNQMNMNPMNMNQMNPMNQNNAGYGMNMGQVNQMNGMNMNMNPNQMMGNAGYGMNQPNGMNIQMPHNDDDVSVANVFDSNDSGHVVTGIPAKAPADQGLSRDDVTNMCMNMAAGKIPTEEQQIKDPTNVKSPDAIAASVFGFNS